MFTKDQLEFIRQTIHNVTFTVKGDEVGKFASTISAIEAEIEEQLKPTPEEP